MVDRFVRAAGILSILACSLAPVLVVQSQYVADPRHCPDPGLLAWPHPTACDRYTRCENGTVTEEVCPNGLLFDPHGGIFDFCNYNWRSSCPGVKRTLPFTCGSLRVNKTSEGIYACS